MLKWCCVARYGSGNKRRLKGEWDGGGDVEEAQSEHGTGVRYRDKEREK